MTRREPPLHGEFYRPSSNLDQEWVNYLIALGEEEQSPGLREANLRVNSMLDKHEVDTIYRPGLSGEELLERGRGVLNSGLRRLESNDFSMLDLSAYEGYRNDDLELKRTIARQVIMYQILERVFMERSAIGVSLVEMASRTITGDTIEPMRKIVVITERLLDLKETSRSPWFKFLNEALGGEGVSSGQVEKEMNAQAAANKTRDQDAKFLEFLDGIFMETGGGLPDDQILSVAGSVTSLATIEEMGGQNNREGSFYSNYMVDLKRIGLSNEQITTLIAVYKKIMQKPSNAEE
ncbi:hypothetical protein GWK77_00390 [Candidatus Saccharibacteria bacterium oral taxon 488]|nr:hypothetical protein GWK77_00390 [Candidatus Saccharibacteria bacterium oral taxon 488]